MGLFQLLLIVESLAGALGIGVLANKRKKLGDAMIYAAVVAVAIIVTGVVGNVAANPGESHFRVNDGEWWSTVLTIFGVPFPFLGGAVGMLVKPSGAPSAPAPAPSATTGAVVGCIVGMVLAFGGCGGFNGNLPTGPMILGGVFVALPGLLLGWVASSQRAKDASGAEARASDGPMNAQERLRKLDALREQGLVSAQEYQAKRTEILKAL